MESTTVGFPFNFEQFVNDSAGVGDVNFGDNGTGPPSGMRNGNRAALWTFLYRVVPSFYLVICVVGLLGNGVVMAALWSIMSRNTMKSVTDILVINLAAADFIFVGSLPFWATELYMKKKWVFGTIGCKTMSFITLLNLYGSVFFLVAMGIDRYLAVVYAVRARNYRTPRKAVIASIIIWFLATLVAMQALIWRVVDVTPAGEPRCNWKIPPSFTKAYYGIRMTLGFFLPFVVIVYCYILIMVKLHRRVTSRLSGSSMTNKQQKITRAILAVISLFVACWLPNHVVTMILTITLEERNDQTRLNLWTANLVSVCLAYANSAINPILYAFMKEEIRQEGTEMLLRIFFCCRRNRRMTRAGNASRFQGMKFSFWRSHNATAVTALSKKDGGKTQADKDAKKRMSSENKMVTDSPDAEKSRPDSQSVTPTTPGLTQLNEQNSDGNFNEHCDDVAKVNLIVRMDNEF